MTLAVAEALSPNKLTKPNQTKPSLISVTSGAVRCSRVVFEHTQACLNSASVTKVTLGGLPLMTDTQLCEVCI